MKKGIDVSAYQGRIDWSRVDTDFAILRAGFGTSADGLFERNYSGCEENEIPKGCYWFGYAVTTDEAKAEAAAMLGVIGGKRFEYPVYYDVETRAQFRLGRANFSRVIAAFLDELTANGFMAGLYMSAYYLSNVVEDELLERYPVWVADYGSEPEFRGHFGMWQYGIAGSRQFNTTNAPVPNGIDSECDLDYCYADYPSRIRALGLNGYARSDAPRKTLNELAHEVLRGDWGNGTERRERLTEAGYSYSRVQQRVDDLLTAEIAAQVIQGKWGSGEERRLRLTQAGYNYSRIQAMVDKMVK